MLSRSTFSKVPRRASRSSARPMNTAKRHSRLTVSRASMVRLLGGKASYQHTHRTVARSTLATASATSRDSFEEPMKTEVGNIVEFIAQLDGALKLQRVRGQCMSGAVVHCGSQMIFARVHDAGNERLPW